MCDLAFVKLDAGDGAASVVILVFSVIVMIGVFWVDRFNPPAWVHAVIWPAVTIPAAILMMRPFKAALVNQQCRHRATEMGL